MVAVRKIENFGHKMTVANNGKEALAALENNRSTWCSWTCRCPRWTASRPPPPSERGDEDGRHTSDNRHDGTRDEGGPGAVPGRRDGRLRLEARSDGGNPPGAGGRPVHSLCAHEAPASKDGARPACDLRAALEQVGGDKQFLNEVIALFRQDAARLLGEVRAAVARGTPAASGGRRTP